MNRHTFACISFFLLLVTPPIAQSQSGALEDLFAQGNTHYQEGEFSEAKQTYKQLLSQGIESSALYYNLGNTCFKEGTLGEAIYFWEKARQTAPADQEVLENLDLARLMLVDKIEVPPEPLPLRLLDTTVHFLTIQQDAWMALLLFSMANLALGSYFLSRTRAMASFALWSSLVAGAFFLIFAVSLAWKVYEEQYRQEGIVIDKKIDVRSGPSEENITMFTIHEGLRVQVRGEAEDWYQISLSNGWTGWLKKDAVGVL